MSTVSSTSTAPDDDNDRDDVPLLPSWTDRRTSGKEEGSGRTGEGEARGRRGAATGVRMARKRVLLFCCVLLLAIAALSWAARVAYSQHNGYQQAVFAPPMQPKPKSVEGAMEPFPRWMRWNETRVEAGKEEGKSAGVALAGTGETEGAEGDVEWNFRRFNAIQDELDRRLLDLDLPPSTALPCSSVSSTVDLLSRYSPLRGLGSPSASSGVRTGPTLFALNLFNSASVLPSLSRTLLSLSSFLGPSTIHISIFENGSTDNTTLALSHLAAALTALGTPHTILSDPRPTDWTRVDRIAQLALYRNVALSPLENPSNGLKGAEDVVFINDVFACPRDALELMFQRRAQEADAACAMDWRENKGLAKRWNSSIKFYDNWVARSITGHLLRFKLDVFSEWRDGLKELFDQPGEEYSRERFEMGLPVPVYSCWNGMLALSAAPFLSSATSPRYASSSAASSPFSRGQVSWARPKPVEMGEGPTRFRSALRSEGECAASECKTVARDLWTKGFDRWMIVPTVRVTYDLSTYLHPQLVQLSSLNPPSSSHLSLSPPSLSPQNGSLTLPTLPPTVSNSTSPSPPLPTALSERIDWPSLTPPNSSVCFPWARGWHIDLEVWRATLEAPFASSLKAKKVARWAGEKVRKERG
ncbi:hypothetical protein JCM8547_001184 [Rhodosporidiobolus lusitaniae]